MLRPQEITESRKTLKKKILPHTQTKKHWPGYFLSRKKSHLPIPEWTTAPLDMKKTTWHLLCHTLPTHRQISSLEVRPPKRVSRTSYSETRNGTLFSVLPDKELINKVCRRLKRFPIQSDVSFYMKHISDSMPSKNPFKWSKYLSNDWWLFNKMPLPIIGK